MKDERLYLIHIKEAIERIEHYTQDSRDVFMGSEMIQDAVIRNFEIIGEAVKRLPDYWKEQYPAIPWKQIAGFRDVLIHNYDRVKLDLVWETLE